MTIWMIDPKSPLIFRDGKPFGTVPGARAQTLPFPYPSTIAGGLRTHAGPDAQGQWSKTRIDELLGMQVRGPLLVQRSAEGAVQSWLLPAPADALVLSEPDKQNEGIRYWLRPLSVPSDVAVDLPNLALIGPGQRVKAKPHPHPPTYWYWETYQRWLESPTDDGASVTVSSWGHNGPTVEYRTHVTIAPETQAAVEGALFQTSGLEFMCSEHGSQNDSSDRAAFQNLRDLALVIDTDGDAAPGFSFLGGERRVVYWQKVDDAFPSCPPTVRSTLLTHGYCRLLLLTPACFEQGFLPGWLSTCTPGVGVTVIGAAIPRYQAVSGWDYVAKRPKPTRLLAPAGSVYYLKVDGDAASLERFISTIWMKNVSDEAQDRADGLGLAVLGSWDGQRVNVHDTLLEDEK